MSALQVKTKYLAAGMLVILCANVSDVQSATPARSNSVDIAAKIIEGAANLQDNSGFALQADVSAFAGVTGALEVVQVNGQIAFYCVAGVTAKLEVPGYAAVGASRIGVRGCPQPASYEGGFLGFTASVGGNFIARADLGASINYGLKYDDFMQTLYSNISRHPVEMLQEIQTLASCLDSSPMSRLLGAQFRAIMSALPQALPSLNLGATVNTKARQQIAAINQELKRRDKSCAQSSVTRGMKSVNTTWSKHFDPKNPVSAIPSKEDLQGFMNEIAPSGAFPYLNAMQNEIFKNDLSGCDSVTLGVEVGVEAIPTAVTGGAGVSLTNYKRIGPTIPIGVMARNFTNSPAFAKVIDHPIDTAVAAGDKVCDAAGNCFWRVCNGLGKCVDTAYNAAAHPIDTAGKCYNSVSDATGKCVDAAGKYVDATYNAASHPYETACKIADGVQKCAEIPLKIYEDIKNTVNECLNGNLSTLARPLAAWNPKWAKILQTADEAVGIGKHE